MSNYIDGFLGISISMLALQLLFSLIGVPFDGRFLPLRMNSIKRIDNAGGGSVLLRMLYFDENALHIDFLHLGSILFTSLFD